MYLMRHAPWGERAVSGEGWLLAARALSGDGARHNPLWQETSCGLLRGTRAGGHLRS